MIINDVVVVIIVLIRIWRLAYDFDYLVSRLGLLKCIVAAAIVNDDLSLVKVKLSYS